MNQPGSESRRPNRVISTSLDKIEFATSELAAAFNHFQSILIWGHTFCPKEFFYEHLEKKFAKVVVRLINVDQKDHSIDKPSLTLNKVRF